jgi:hypothetical protein
MKEKELLKQCKFYKGEETNPFPWEDRDARNFWLFEADFVYFSIRQMNGEEKLTCYKKVGGKDFPIPPLLLYFMWHYWSKYCYYDDDLTPFYEMVERYIKAH